ncbi:MAG: hypothetical protein FWD71_00435 [Oscillospiraceae bacterium]|nr:hypothetical protein [Oscillospiraceae bacterium]
MNNTQNKKAKKLWAVLLPLGILLIVAGIIQNDYHDTLIKAVTICLECIGIG